MWVGIIAYFEYKYSDKKSLESLLSDIIIYYSILLDSFNNNR